MPKLDDIFQVQLEALETGKTLKSVLADLPEGLSELTPLIQLAAAIRECPVPDPDLSDTFVQDVCASMKKAKGSQSGWRELFRRILSPSTGRLMGATLAAVLVVVSILSFVFWFGRNRDAHKVTLIEVAGLVEIASDESAGGWQQVADGQHIKVGQRIRTGVDGTATLLFFEGSRAILGSSTDLILSSVGGDGLEELSVAMEQRAGETAHSVVPLRGDESAYQVHTLSGTASVQGTNFRVFVPEAGAARFVVDMGEVLITSDGQEMMLTAGQVAMAQPDVMLGDPAYGFTLKGYLAEVNGDTWVVSGIPFQVTPETHLKDNPQVDTFVLVEGRIFEDGTWVADVVMVKNVTKVKSSFAGILESIGDTWVIGGIAVSVSDQTDIDAGLVLGEPVEVTFIILEDGGWFALKIESLVDEPGGPLPDPVIIDDPIVIDATPSIKSPETLSESEIIDCVGVDPQPKAWELAYTYHVTYDKIMGWFCQGYGFGEIDLAYELSLVSDMPVEEIFAMRESGMGWGQIKAQLEPTKTPKPIKELKPTKKPKKTKDPKD